MTAYFDTYTEARAHMEDLQERGAIDSTFMVDKWQDWDGKYFYELDSAPDIQKWVVQRIRRIEPETVELIYRGCVDDNGEPMHHLTTRIIKL